VAVLEKKQKVIGGRAETDITTTGSGDVTAADQELRGIVHTKEGTKTGNIHDLAQRSSSPANA